MAAVTIFSDFGVPRKKIYHCFHSFPIYLPWSDGTRCHDLHFLKLSFKPTFSLSSCTFNQKLFSSSLLSAIRVVSSAYLRFLIFLPAILIPVCASSSPAFSRMFSAYNLVVIHTVKGFGIVNKAKVGAFLELPCFFDDPANVVNLISGSFAFSITSFTIWKSTVQVPLKPSLENSEHYFASM